MLGGWEESEGRIVQCPVAVFEDFYPKNRRSVFEAWRDDLLVLTELEFGPTSWEILLRDSAF